jgi:protein-S-isoprenylcysteine O-methyltransferase Ste14
VRERLARWRVPLGFAAAAVAYALAHPSPRSIAFGAAVAAAGEAIRIWAAGHVEKGREVTRSGPYRYVRHPLYLGSSVMGAGFAWASRAWPSAAVTALYLGITLAAAIRTEEAALDAKFAGAYAEYRAGRAAPVARSFSLARARANREYRSAAGVAVAFVLLWLRMSL